MGITSDGIMFYGLCFGDSDDAGLPWLDGYPDNDPEDWLCDHLGGPARPQWDDTKGRFVTPLRDYWHARKAFLSNHFGVEIRVDTHCSSTCPMYFVAIASTHEFAHRGYPVAVPQPPVKPEWDAGLRKVCEAAGINWPGAAWWLVSYLG